MINSNILILDLANFGVSILRFSSDKFGNHQRRCLLGSCLSSSKVYISCLNSKPTFHLLLVRSICHWISKSCTLPGLEISF
uniref:Uncharacterized protein n=1 Tax=Rhizophora mucronata TaxID=61149 RepID=A0A2P2J7D1_RHIMU